MASAIPLYQDYPIRVIYPKRMVFTQESQDDMSSIQPFLDMPSSSITTLLWRRLPSAGDTDGSRPVALHRIIRDNLARAIRCPPLTCSAEDMRPA